MDTFVNAYPPGPKTIVSKFPDCPIVKSNPLIPAGKQKVVNESVYPVASIVKLLRLPEVRKAAGLPFEVLAVYDATAKFNYKLGMRKKAAPTHVPKMKAPKAQDASKKEDAKKRPRGRQKTPLAELVKTLEMGKGKRKKADKFNAYLPQLSGPYLKWAKQIIKAWATFGKRTLIYKNNKKKDVSDSDVKKFLDRILLEYTKAGAKPAPKKQEVADDQKEGELEEKKHEVQPKPEPATAIVSTLGVELSDSLAPTSAEPSPEAAYKSDTPAEQVIANEQAKVDAEIKVGGPAVVSSSITEEIAKDFNHQLQTGKATSKSVGLLIQRLQKDADMKDKSVLDLHAKLKGKHKFLLFTQLKKQIDNIPADKLVNVLGQAFPSKLDAYNSLIKKIQTDALLASMGAGIGSGS